MTPISLTATPPVTAPYDDDPERYAYETRTPETTPAARSEEAPAQSLVAFGVALDDLARLDADWDSYGAQPPSRLVRVYAWSFVSMLAGRGVPVPQVFPTRGGGIQLEWHRPAASLEWEVDDNPATGVFIFDDHTTGERIDGELPDALEGLARAIQRVTYA